MVISAEKASDFQPYDSKLHGKDSIKCQQLQLNHTTVFCMANLSMFSFQ